MRRAILGAVAVLFLAVPSAAAAADNEPPKIVHTAVTSAPQGAALKIVADIVDESGVFEPKLQYRAAGTKTYFSTSLVLQSGNSYAGTITDSVMGADVEYFLEAYDSNGNGPARFASDVAPQLIKVVAPPPTAKVDVPPPPAEDPNAGTRPAVRAPDAAVAKAEEPSSGFGMKVAGYALIGVGVVGIGVGAGMGAMVGDLAKQAQDATSAKDAKAKEDQAKTNAMIANVGTIAGGVLAAAGVVLAVLPLFSSSSSPDAKPSEDRTFDANLFIGPAGATVAGTF